MTTGTPAVADVTAVQGDATALSIAGTDVVPGVTGQATFPTPGYGPIGSGELPSGVDCATGIIPTLPGLPGGVLLSLGLLEQCTRGGNVGTHQGFAESQARVVDLQLGASDLGVITSSCVATGDGAVGDTTIIGSPVLPENPTPGQTVPVPIIPPILGVGGLTVDVVLNEQIVTNVPGTAEITVNALRVNILGIEIIVGQVHCLATGPDVNVTTTTTAPTTTTTAPTTTTSTTLPDGTTTTTSTTLPDGTTTTTSTTLPDGTTTTTTVAPGGGGNNNNNNNQNNNTSNNTNNNSTTNNNSNTNTNSQTQNQTNNQSQTNSQTQTGGDNSNENVISITNLGSNFDGFHHRGIFSNDEGVHGVHGGHDGRHFNTALARTGSESSRLTGVALLLLLVGGVLVLGTRTVTAEAAAVPGSRSRRRDRRSVRALFSPSRRWR